MEDIKLKIDKEGGIYLEITHRDKSESLEQVILGNFIRQAKEKGLSIKHLGGYISTDTDPETRSHEKYAIEINK